jgi:hypothetical protein
MRGSGDLCACSARVDDVMLEARDAGRSAVDLSVKSSRVAVMVKMVQIEGGSEST